MSRTQTVAIPAAQSRFVDLPRHALFLGLLVACIAWFWKPLSTVVSLSLRYGDYEHYSHIIAMPFLTVFLLWVDRRTIFATVGRSGYGAAILASGIVASWIPSALDIARETAWALSIVMMVATFAGAFLLCYGTGAFRKAAFPLLLLILMSPMPPSVLQSVIRFLQVTSAEATAVIFQLLGVPLYRDGFLFSLPGLNIRIAEECSGIRSSMALFILSLVSGYLFLRSAWARSALVVLAIPLAIVKNAVRIVVLSLLAIHVDPSFIGAGSVHRNSGIPLFAVSFAIMGLMIWLLQKSESRLGGRGAADAGR
jgi:exosortase